MQYRAEEGWARKKQWRRWMRRWKNRLRALGTKRIWQDRRLPRYPGQPFKEGEKGVQANSAGKAGQSVLLPTAQEIIEDAERYLRECNLQQTSNRNHTS